MKFENAPFTLTLPYTLVQPLAFKSIPVGQQNLPVCVLCREYLKGLLENIENIENKHEEIS